MTVAYSRVYEFRWSRCAWYVLREGVFLLCPVCPLVLAVSPLRLPMSLDLLMDPPSLLLLHLVSLRPFRVPVVHFGSSWVDLFSEINSLPPDRSDYGISSLF